MRRMNADLIRGIRDHPWFICPNLLWFDLVALSECQTRLGEKIRCEGLAGLPWGLYEECLI
jgi:hypothetical protein